MTPRDDLSHALHSTGIHLLELGSPTSTPNDMRHFAIPSGPLDDIKRDNDQPIFGEVDSEQKANRLFLAATHLDNLGIAPALVPSPACVVFNSSFFEEKVVQANRLPNRTVVPKYEPVTILTRDWDDFMAAFFAIFSCHAMLRSIDLCHRGICLNNMVWDPIGTKPKLCDFDLCHFAESLHFGAEEKPAGFESYSSTNTWMFMARELLTRQAMAGGVKRVYRHEVEAFLALLVWITCQYEDGNLQESAPFDDWNKAHYGHILSNRDAAYEDIDAGTLSQSPSLSEDLWESICMTIGRRLYRRALPVDPASAWRFTPKAPRDDYDGMRALDEALTWPIFEHTQAEHFVALLKLRIGPSPVRLVALEDADLTCTDVAPAYRVPYPVAMPLFEPISALTKNWDDFMGAFFTLFHCHAMLWHTGIRHGRISPSNLMGDPVAKTPKLCDFDLSHFAEPPQSGEGEKPIEPKGYSNTGTWIFMANELLTGRAMAGKVKRVYRHEVESFIAVLLWVTCQYKDGKLQKPARLDNWNQIHYQFIQDAREHTYKDIEDNIFPWPSSLDGKLWRRVRGTIIGLNGFLGAVKTARSQELEYQDALEDYPPDEAESYKPDTPVHEFDGLRSLLKIFNWPIFKHPRAEPFVRLTKECIGLTSGNSTPTST